MERPWLAWIRLFPCQTCLQLYALHLCPRITLYYARVPFLCILSAQHLRLRRFETLKMSPGVELSRNFPVCQLPTPPSPSPLTSIHITADRHFNFCLILSDPHFYRNFSRNCFVSIFIFFIIMSQMINSAELQQKPPRKENYSKETLKSSVWWAAMVCGVSVNSDSFIQ